MLQRMHGIRPAAAQGKKQIHAVIHRQPRHHTAKAQRNAGQMPKTHVRHPGGRGEYEHRQQVNQQGRFMAEEKPKHRRQQDKRHAAYFD